MKAKPGKNAIRDWTLYIVKLNDGSYYIGITAYKDFTRRIRQHGSNKGASWARGKSIDEIVEVQHLGKMTRLQAENTENNVTLEYRKKYGRKVRGGYNALVKNSLVPNLTPGSAESTIFILTALMVAFLCLVFIYFAQ